VVKTGSYKHIPGMSVLHALILAGALETAAGDEWRLLDLAREKERLLKSTERLSRLMARTELLKGEREELASPGKTAGADAKGRLAEAKILLRLENARRAEQEAAVDAKLQSYRTELSIQRKTILGAWQMSVVGGNSQGLRSKCHKLARLESGFDAKIDGGFARTYLCYDFCKRGRYSLKSVPFEIKQTYPRRGPLRQFS
jgi:hypothetical protein